MNPKYFAIKYLVSAKSKVTRDPTGNKQNIRLIIDQ